MKSFIIALIMVMVSVSSSFANTIMWYWHTPEHEVITYTVDIDSGVGTSEMNAFNRAIDIISRNGEFSNLEQFQDKINEIATGSIRNFVIVDVRVDEK